MPINLYQGGENGLWTFLLVTILMGGLALGPYFDLRANRGRCYKMRLDGVCKFAIDGDFGRGLR